MAKMKRGELKNVMKAMMVILEHAVKLPNEGWGQSGTLICPMCRETTLRWYRSKVNGHVQAACKNKCVAFIQ